MKISVLSHLYISLVSSLTVQVISNLGVFFVVDINNRLPMVSTQISSSHSVIHFLQTLVTYSEDSEDSCVTLGQQHGQLHSFDDS